MAAPVPPPAKKRKKEGPARLEEPPLLPDAGWPALPPDLVRRVADCLLATNDLDCYMDYRAVCSGWRAATDDPRTRSAASDPRFRLRRWIVLDDIFHSQGEAMLLLNADTGRFLRKKLPPLSDHSIVATTRSGYFVLAKKSPPHAARVLNPLTGVVIRFVAPVAPDVGSADVVFIGSSWVKLTLFCDASRKVYWAGHNSIRFFVHEPKQETYRFLRKTTLGGVSADDTKDPMKSTASLYSFLVAVDIMFFPVGLARHMFVTNVEGSIYVFKNEIGKLVALDSINNYAIFIGHQRSLAIDADKFPGIEANCVYYTDILGSSAHICKCNIKDRKVERISEAAEFVKRGKQFVLVADRPSTIIHLLSSYTINIPESQLALQQIQ
ncbi:uncharacterized protein [Triticum aestivum]|uniref:uncharacterized protein n=1 Tax=Triticum aestivum TaxID=4565 RepID=UPI001D024582|nr:uncharacterized protein LOC123075592 [Triticum aestivum]